jgi:hypothetical protein
VTVDRCNCDRPSLGGYRYEHRATCPKSPRVEISNPEDCKLFSKVEWKPACQKRLVCGGKCVLRAEHSVPCECGGDDPGYPKTCPA